jgi:hypothetical protein
MLLLGVLPGQRLFFLVRSGDPIALFSSQGGALW